MAPVRVVVAGAGVGGLTAALCLARTGAHVELHEAAPSLRQSGTGLGLQPNGLAVLDALGVVDDLVPLGSRMDHVTLFGSDGGRLSRVEVPQAPGLPVPSLVLARGPLVDVLAAHVERAGIEIHLGSAITELVDGVDLVVAADGVRSTLRTQSGIRWRRFGASRWYARCMVPVPTPEAIAGEHWAPGGIAGILPCGPDHTYLYSSASPALRDALAAKDLAGLQRIVADRFPAQAAIVAELDDLDGYRVDEVEGVWCRRFVAHRLALLGDAAHAMAPNLGQGANDAIVDAATLAIEVARHAGIAPALDAYDRRRRRAVQRVQRNAEMLAWFSHLGRGQAWHDGLAAASPEVVQRQGIRRAQQCDPTALAAELVGSFAPSRT